MPRKRTNNRVLEVNLTTGTTTIYRVSNIERQMYLGGKGLGLKLLYDRLKTGIDPLGEENILAFMPGVLMASGAPCSGRFAALTKSPLTGLMVSSSCGGPFGMELKKCGWDGLLITGKALDKTLLTITEEGVEFEDAKNLWGKDTLETEEEIKKAKTKKEAKSLNLKLKILHAQRNKGIKIIKKLKHND
jgi:aldehyde:ferredoxin oxidoreductase